VVGKGGITGIGESVESRDTLGATVGVRHSGFSFSGTLAVVVSISTVSGIGIAVVSTVVSTIPVSVSVVAGVAVVTTIVSSGGISLRFGISITFVELVDAISGSSSGDMLVAGSNSWAVAVVGTIRITVSSIRIAGIAVMASIQVCGIGLGISLGFSISGTLAVVVSISVSAISTVVSTISVASVPVSVSVVAGVAIVSTIVVGSGIGISLGLGGHDGKESNGEKSEILHVY
jgi:hypothetical protein